MYFCWIYMHKFNAFISIVDGCCFIPQPNKFGRLRNGSRDSPWYPRLIIGVPWYTRLKVVGERGRETVADSAGRPNRPSVPRRHFFAPSVIIAGVLSLLLWRRPRSEVPGVCVASCPLPCTAAASSKRPGGRGKGRATCGGRRTRNEVHNADCPRNCRSSSRLGESLQTRRRRTHRAMLHFSFYFAQIRFRKDSSRQQTSHGTKFELFNIFVLKCQLFINIFQKKKFNRLHKI